MHRKIDAFTDRHPIFQQSKLRLRAQGYLRGVVIDLSYDHMLMKNWARYDHTVTARAFLDNFYRNAEQVLDQYPDAINQFVRRIIEADTLGRYAAAKGIQRGMRKVDHRLSPRVLNKERATDYWDDVLREYNHIEADFLEFFPALQEHVAERKNQAPSLTG
jgi:acyl carrier protein phosphodiesterase